MQLLPGESRRSAPRDLSGEELVAPDAHSIPDDGARMRAVMDSVVGEESLASGGVSAEEIADALAKSIPSLPPPPAPAMVPQGRPPSAVPAGRPPVVIPQGRPPAPTSATYPASTCSGNAVRSAFTTGWFTSRLDNGAMEILWPSVA